MKLKLCVVTGSRADYGLFRPLLKKMNEDRDLTLQLIVTGSHLSKKFGFSLDEIKRDPFNICALVDIRLNGDSALRVIDSIGIGCSPFGRVLTRLNPHAVVIQGDRIESFMAASVAHVLKIPLIHLSGGEVTSGVIDEAMRHSITKMSCLHFAANASYQKRIIQLGEHPKTVFNVGEPGLEDIKVNLLSKKDLEESLEYEFIGKNILLTFHPQTLDSRGVKQYFSEVLAALKSRPDIKIIFTYANADPDGKVINQMIEEFLRQHPTRGKAYPSLGRRRYLSCMQFVDAVVGNSSSGLAEAPSFKIGTINIGDRQQGRLKAGSVIDCTLSKAAITQAFDRLYSPSFLKKLSFVKNPYEGKNTSNRIIQIIKRFRDSLVDRSILKKVFYDLP